MVKVVAKVNPPLSPKFPTQNHITRKETLFTLYHRFKKSSLPPIPKSKGGVQMQKPTNMNGLRSYSTCSRYDCKNKNIKEFKTKRVNKSGKNEAFWGMNMDEPELQRKKRVAGYKAYKAEAKMKGSVKKSFRWFKEVCNQVVHGFWGVKDLDRLKKLEDKKMMKAQLV